MKNLLVLTDFSELSRHALDFALDLAKPLHAKVTILNIQEIPLADMELHLSGDASQGGYSNDTLYNAQLLRASKTKLNELAAEYADSVNLQVAQVGGGFRPGVKHFMEKNPVDMIFIGTTGEQSAEEFFSGNHTEQLIEHFDVPIVSVKEKVEYPLKDIVLGIDLVDEDYPIESLDKIRNLINPLDATLHIVNIISGRNYDGLENEIDELAKKVRLENYLIEVIQSINDTRALQEYAQKVNAGLIITLSSAMGGLFRFFQESFSTDLTKESNIPILTLNKRLVEH